MLEKQFECPFTLYYIADNLLKNTEPNQDNKNIIRNNCRHSSVSFVKTVASSIPRMFRKLHLRRIRDYVISIYKFEGCISFVSVGRK